jgi:hypothetical protein
MKVPSRWAVVVVRSDRVTVEVLPYLYTRKEEMETAIPHLEKSYRGVTLVPVECKFKLISRGNRARHTA